MQLKILVVLYDCQPNDSLTLVSLTGVSFIQDSMIDLVVINNGPHQVDPTDLVIQSLRNNYRVTLVQQLDNNPLSTTYNRHVPSSGSYLLLDQDTKLTQVLIDEFSVFHQSKADIYLPQILSNGKVVYPKARNVISNFDLVDELKIVSITSGMLIRESLIKRCRYKYGQLFDERYVFYGVDSTFFYRLWALEKVVLYLGTAIEHDLTSALTLNEIDSWRYNERLIDHFLQLRHFPTLRTFKNVLSFVKNSRLKRLASGLPLALRCLCVGRHPRSRYKC